MHAERGADLRMGDDRISAIGHRKKGSGVGSRGSYRHFRALTFTIIARLNDNTPRHNSMEIFEKYLCPA